MLLSSLKASARAGQRQLRYRRPRPRRRVGKRTAHRHLPVSAPAFQGHVLPPRARTARVHVRLKGSGFGLTTTKRRASPSSGRQGPWADRRVHPFGPGVHSASLYKSQLFLFKKHVSIIILDTQIDYPDCHLNPVVPNSS